MGFLFGNNDKWPEFIYEKLDLMDDQILQIRLMFLESERHRMGLTSDDEYKHFINTAANLGWNSLTKRNKRHDESRKEEFDRFLNDNRKEIIELAAKQLTESTKRTKAWKEKVAEV